jgi:hypothetical protein
MRQDGTALDLRADTIAAAFMHDCEPDIVAWAVPQFRAQPLAPIVTPLRLSERHYGSVPRDYISCLEDRAIDLPLQRRMLERAPCRRVIELPLSHSPFLAAPCAQVRALHSLVQEPSPPSAR